MQSFEPQVASAESKGDGVVLVELGSGQGLFDVLAPYSGDSSVRVLVVTGQGEHFCKGSEGQAACSCPGRLAELRQLRMPVIACINGDCRGAGFSLALACDLRFASEAAVFEGGFAAHGLVAEDAAAHTLPQLVGTGDAMLQLFAGEALPAARCPPGLVQRTFPKEHLLTETLAFARKLAVSAAPTSVALTKQQVYLLPRRSAAEARAIAARLATEPNPESAEVARASAANEAPHFADYDDSSPLVKLAHELLADGSSAVTETEGASAAVDSWLPGSGSVTAERHEGGVVQLTLAGLDADFFGALSHYGRDASVRAVVVTGSGAAFVPDGSAECMGSCCAHIRSMHMPVIACIQGSCFGTGLCLALACDLRFAAKDTMVRAGFSQRGQVAQDATANILPSLVGSGDALLLLLAGEELPAEKLPQGLVQRTFAQEDLLPKTLAFAKQLAMTSAPTSVAVIKQQAYQLPHRNYGEAEFMTRALTQSNLFQENPDHAEGIRAFGTNEPPHFNNYDSELPFAKLAAELLPRPASPPEPAYGQPPPEQPPPSDLRPMECILVEEHEGGVVQISLNKRTRMNAWGPDIDWEFFEALNHYDSDPSVRVIVVTGQGYFFCAGADAEFTYDGDSLTQVREKLRAMREFSDIRKMRTPVIACINGACCGIGLSLALACDIRFAANDAKVGVIFPQRGLIGEDGTAYVLPHLVGMGDALLLLLTGDIFLAETLPAGLVQRIVPRKDLLAETLAFAKQLAATASSTSLAVIKQQAYGLPLRPFEEALHISGALAARIRGEGSPEALGAVNSPYNGSAPVASLAREMLGGLLEHRWPAPKPVLKPPEPKTKPAAAKPAAAPAVKAAPKAPETEKAAPKGPQLAQFGFEVTCADGVTIHKKPTQDSPEVGHYERGEQLSAVEETFDGWAKLAEEEGWVRRCAVAEEGPATYLKAVGLDAPALAAPEVCEKSARKFKVVFKPQVGIKAEPRVKAKVQAQKKFGEFVVAETQTYDGWVRLARGQGWILSLGSASGRMLEPVA